MQRKTIIICCILLISVNTFSQRNPFERKADSLFNTQNYKEAAAAYLLAADSIDFPGHRKIYYYKAANCFAKLNEREFSLKYIKKSVYEYGYKSYDNLANNKTLDILHNEEDWKLMMNELKKYKESLRNPRSAKLVTTDIHNFWKAYDAAAADTLNRKKIYRELYIDKASAGLQDYFAIKIGSVDAFVKNQDEKPKFYAGIRNNTLAIDNMKEQIYLSFEKLKALYDDAAFPDIYFVIGRWNSAGTVSDNGMLLGVDQITRTPDVSVEELDLWEKNNFQKLEDLPVITAHELVHFQQTKMKEDTTLLFYAIVEGMADFICELITGKNPSRRQQEYAKTRKKEIWEDFKKEMYLNRAYNWIANSSKETEDKPADLGYYVGYEICKAYYDRSSDKKKAIHDMLNIQDYKEFLIKSGYDELINSR